MKETSKLIKGVPEHIYNMRWKALGALCGSLLLVMLANMGINLALPQMATELKLTTLQITWIVDIYSLVFASLLFTMATLGDRFGRKKIMQLGTILFALSAGYAGLFAGSATEVVIARGIMGIGAAMVMPSTLSIITNIFPRDERAKAIAIWTGVAGGGMALGSILSGFLLQIFNWEATFLFSLVFGGVILAINQIITPNSKDPAKPKIDWLGGILSAAGLFGIIYGIIEAPTHGLTEAGTLLPLVGGIIAFGAFILWQLRAKSPMLDIKLFKITPFTVSALAITLVFFGMMGIFFSLSQLFQLVMGYGVLESSLRMLPISLIMMFAAPLVPSIVKKFGARWTVTSGLILVAAGFALFSQLPVVPAYWQVIAILVVIMVGMTFTMTPSTNMLMSAVPKNRAGMGSAMNDTTRELGGALGIAVLGSILSAAYSKDIASTVANLPDQVRGVAESSLAGALSVAAEMGEGGEVVANAAKEAWMNGLSGAMVVAAGILAVAAVITAKWLPHTHKEHEDDSFADTAIEEQALDVKQK